MAWHGRLHLNYRLDESARTVLHDRHEGPLRVLRSLYPESPAICHNVLVHPPGGIAGGDMLELEATFQSGTHALVTTAGATRFYRSAGEVASQSVSARLGPGARLEWLPLETIAYSGCRAENRLRFELAADAETIGWDVLALGLPASGQPFERGVFTQCVELPGRWLERGVVAAEDRLLLDSALGFAGQCTLATMWFAAGAPLVASRAHALLESGRRIIDAHALAGQAGVTASHAEVVVLRVLGPAVEPVMDLLARVWRTWRDAAWGLTATPPRVWRT